jgi:exoribonuclease R
VPARRILTPPAAIDFDAIRDELQIPAQYPPDAVAEAMTTVGERPGPIDDLTAIPFVTIDPVGSMDLDQAVHLERSAHGYLVRYAIADVTSFVAPGGALAAETWRRGATLYSPDRSTPLHPVELSEGAASLLPDRERPAVLWSIILDTYGEPVDVDVRRALVRSTAQLDYPRVQSDADGGTLHPSIALLPEIGRLRQQRARDRHAINLDLPDSVIVPATDGHWTLELRAITAVEQFNAEISLLTGMCAAKVILDGGVGLLRTMPSPTDGQVQALRRATAALGIPWPAAMPPGDVIAGLNGARPRDAAFLEDALRLLRGAATRRSPARHPRAAVTAGSALRTPTAPRRCGDWPTGSRPRCACRCGRAGRCRNGSAARSASFRRPWRPRIARPPRWPRRAPARWRCSCCTTARERSSPPPCCRSSRNAPGRSSCCTSPRCGRTALRTVCSRVR